MIKSAAGCSLPLLGPETANVTLVRPSPLLTKVMRITEALPVPLPDKTSVYD